VKLARIRAAMLLGALCPAVAAAQGAGASAAAPAAKVQVSAVKVDGRQLRAGTWNYRSTATSNGQSRTIDRVLTVAPATVNGTNAWLVVDAQAGTPLGMYDSLYLSRDAMMPIRHRLHAGPNSVALEFGRDSARGTMTLPQGTGPVAAAYTPGTMVTGTMLEMYLRLLPLAPGYKGALTIGALSPTGTQLAPVNVAVIGEEDATVPAGTFPSYVVTLTGQGSEQKVWVNKATKEVVKINAAFAQMPGAKIETVLMAKK
jgi:hypothetical protein